VTPTAEAWRRFRKHKLAVVSAGLLGIMILAVLFGPLIWTLPIDEIDFTARLQGPSLEHPFGTDDLGQDLLARMLYGGRISLAVGFAAMGVAVTVGVLVGAVAGMSKGPVDVALMWLTDLFLSLPQLPLLLLIIYLFRDALAEVVGQELGVFLMIVAVIGAIVAPLHALVAVFPGLIIDLGVTLRGNLFLGRILRRVDRRIFCLGRIFFILVGRRRRVHLLVQCIGSAGGSENGGGDLYVRVFGRQGFCGVHLLFSAIRSAAR
jgi:ABC-type dipeptide/oligopeptide/nickel transport system permease subunit